jgi:signal transduction histidine kinase
MCNKLEPQYFTSNAIIATFFSLCLKDVFGVIGIGHNVFYWANILFFLTALLFLGLILGKLLVPWLLSLKARNLTINPLTTNEMCCLWYSLSSLLLKFIVPIIFSLPVQVQWSQCTSLQLHVIVYSFALLGVVICNISGRLARATVYTERCLLADIRRIVRYLSHEVRSPLNIIASAIGFMDIDLAALPHSAEKASVADSLLTMRQATQDILQTMNEMLQMETINSGSLHLDLQMVPCGELMEIIQRSGVAAREKGVRFSVQEFLSRDQNGGGGGDGGSEGEGGGSCRERDLESLSDTAVGDIALLVDKFKIGQVVRNLVTNAVKFTPAGEIVAVNIRRATAAEEATIVENRLRGRGLQGCPGAAARSQDVSGLDESSICRSVGHAVIEVVDTGAGISLEDQSKVFGAFTQFRANELQVGISIVTP